MRVRERDRESIKNRPTKRAAINLKLRVMKIGKSHHARHDPTLKSASQPGPLFHILRNAEWLPNLIF